MGFLGSKTGISIILVSLVLLLLLLLRHRKRKMTRKLVVKEVALGSGILVFLPYRGKYSDIAEKFKEIEKDVSEFFQGDLKYFGVYYDDATKVVDPNSCRAIVGICLDRKNGSLKKPAESLPTYSYKESDASMYEVTSTKSTKPVLRSSIRGSDTENVIMGDNTTNRLIKSPLKKGAAKVASGVEDTVQNAIKARASSGSIKVPGSKKSTPLAAKGTVGGNTASISNVGTGKDLINDIVAFLNSHKNYRTVNFTNLKGFGIVVPYKGMGDLKSSIGKGFMALREYGIRKNQMGRCKFAMHISDPQEKTLTFAFPYYKNNESLVDQSGYPAPQPKE